MQDNSNISNEPIGEATSREREPVVRIEDLSHLIRSKRWAERLTLEELATKIGVSAATLSRWERGGVRARTAGGQDGSGKGVRDPDTSTLAALTRWLGVSIDRLVDIEPIQRDTAETAPGTVGTLDIVEAHLRADRNLDAKSAEVLANLFRAVYERLSSPSSESARVEEHDQATPIQFKYEAKKNSEGNRHNKLGRKLEEEQENEPKG